MLNVLDVFTRLNVVAPLDPRALVRRNGGGTATDEIDGHADWKCMTKALM